MSSSWPAPCHRVITSHSTNDTDGNSVSLHISDVPLNPVLSDNAAITPLFSTIGLPTSNSHTLSSSEIDDSVSRVKGVGLKGGVNGQITDVKPNYLIQMHRTNTVDYNIFISGSATLITPKKNEKGEIVEERTEVKAGDIVVQRGTLHAWQAGPEGYRSITVVTDALPVEVGGRKLDEVDFK